MASAVALSPASRVRILDIARAALLQHVGHDEITDEITPGVIPDSPIESSELAAPAGCFVSLHERITHRLRGCVGRLDPHAPLAETVRKTAADVLHDPRFVKSPVTAGEVADLEIEVSVLSPPEEAKSPLDFDLLNDGIYLTFGGRAGFFLPQVARETGWTREQLLDRLCTEKLGLPPDAWKKPEAKLFTFKVEVVGPEAV
jgi:AmmeMemoRadiSam system protein A